MSRVLYIKAESRLLNPTLDAQMIEEAYADDREAAASEWGGEFRESISQAFPDVDIDAAIEGAPTQRPYQPALQYVCFCDPAGGRGADAMTLAIAHGNADERLILDRLLIVPPPFDTEKTAENFAEVARSFRLSSITGDAYSGDWVAASFRRYGITYDLAGLSKSEIYAEVIPLFSQARIELLDVPQLTTQLRLLERRPRMGGKGDLIDHPPRAHDDAANAACGALWRASTQARVDLVLGSNVGRCATDYDPYNAESLRRARGGYR